MSLIADAPAGAPPGAARALLLGNFAIGCGVMVVAGSLNDLTRSLQVSVAVAGQLITAAALAMSLGAPLLAALLAGFDRRRLLTFALLWYAVGHAISALAPDYAWLLPVRALTMLAAAVFTPQAAAAIAWLAPPAARGKAITYIFLGWSVASVFGMPLHSFIGEALGWRYAFALVGALSLAGAWAVWRSVPDDIRPPPLRLAQWREVLTHPVLMAMVAVTALSGSGQFTLFAYFAPIYRQALGATPVEVSLLFFWFGGFGLLGNVLLSQHVDRFGAGRAVNWLLGLMALSILFWPLATSVWIMPLVLLPWAFAGFASNSAQQARLGSTAPELAPALMALNTSAIYLGQALGAGGGGAMVAANQALGQSPYAGLHWPALAWMLLAIALSLWVSRQLRRQRAEADEQQP